MVMEKVDNKKFTEEELKEIRTIKDGMANISQILGQIGFSKYKQKKTKKKHLINIMKFLQKKVNWRKNQKQNMVEGLWI